MKRFIKCSSENSNDAKQYDWNGMQFDEWYQDGGYGGYQDYEAEIYNLLDRRDYTDIECYPEERGHGVEVNVICFAIQDEYYTVDEDWDTLIHDIFNYGGEAAARMHIDTILIDAFGQGPIEVVE